MFKLIRHPWTFLALLTALTAVILSKSQSASTSDDLYNQVQGKNNTILFLVNSNHGYSNVHLATAYALLEKHPSVELHFGTFEKMRSRVERVSKTGASASASPSAQPISFHVLPSDDYLTALAAQGVHSTAENMIVPPGLVGSRYQAKNLRWIFSPWAQEDHLAIYRTCRELIDEIDPALVVLDPIFRPAIEATQDTNRLYTVLSPMTFEVFFTDQPWGKWLWKFPAISSGFGYPLPWSKIPLNIAVNLNLAYNVVTAPGAETMRQFLRDNGVQNPLDFIHMHRLDAPWITQAMREAAMPLEYLPPNVSAVGPILLSLDSVEDQDAELGRWLEGAPTVLINLGSIFKYTEGRARLMASAIKNVLQQTDVQFLWKLDKAGDYSDEFLDEVEEFIGEGRLRIQDWLTVDPAALVQHSRVVASVHHGGSNCYHEALSAGVPQVVLPLWFDHYDFATYAEYYGIGVWGCRETAPEWTVEGLTEAFLRVLDDGEAGVAMREKAGRLGDMARASPGRDAAARQIADLAASGKP